MRSVLLRLYLLALAAGGCGWLAGQEPNATGERTIFGAVGARAEVAAGLAVAGAGLWQQPYVPGGGYWRRRLTVVIANLGDNAVTDEPVVLPVGVGEGALRLAGVEVRELRVCAVDGTEFLFGVQDADGASVTSGRLQDGFRLLIPAECEAGEVRPYHVYADNPQAWAVPDFLDVRTAVLNAGFEQGTGAVPAGWTCRGTDEQHAIVWERGSARNGERCVSMSVIPGVAASWFTATQSGIRVTPGSRYTLRGWVKGREVVGQAGLYVHVADGANPQAVNRVESAGVGTFDWREVAIEFTAPPGATTVSLGTVLHGSGSAWYDDLEFEQQAPPSGSRLRVTVGAEERLDLETLGAAAPWPEGTPAPDYRMPLTVRNFSAQPFAGIVLADVPRLRGQLAAGEEVGVRVPGGATAAWRPCVTLAGAVAFRASVPARSELVCQAYALPAGGGPPAASAAAVYRDLLDPASGNLVRNPDLEDGEGTPAAWSTGVEVSKREGASQFSPDDPQVTYEWLSPGFLGSTCVRMTVGKDAKPAWRGWRQTLAVKPETTYLYAGWVRTRDVTGGEVRLHGHTLDAEGKRCGAYHAVGTAAGQGLTGSNDWTLLVGTLRTSAETRSVTVYLTMDATGTVDHDAVLFCEVTEASVGEGESHPSRLTRDLTVWQVNPIVKVFRDHRPGPAVATVAATAARHEKECVQLALLPRRDESVTVAVQAPVHASGYRLPEVTVESVGYVPVDHVSAFFTAKALGARRVLPQGSPISDGWVGWWPDPLLPVRGPLTLAAGRVQPLWLTFAIPGDAPAGEYRGVLTLDSATGRTEIALRATVWDFAIPVAPRLTALFDLREGPGWQFLTPESRRVWLRFMADRRLCVDQILPAPIMRLEKGQVTLDTAAFDQAAAWCFDELHLRTAYLPLEFYAFGWGHDTRPFQGFAAGSPEYREAYGTCLAALWKHVQAKGWAERFVLYVADEPHFDDRDPALAARVLAQMQAQCALIHAAAPGLKVYSSTWRHTPAWDDDLDIWGAGAFGCFPVETMDRLRAAGRTIWFTTDAQLLLDTPYSAIERLNPYYCFAYGADGYEFWALGWWTYAAYDPLRYGWYAYIPHTFTSGGPTSMIRYPNGSGHLSYPGWLVGETGPLSSIRLEQVREGMEDFEYLALLRERIAAARQRGADVSAATAVLARVRDFVPIPNAGGTRSTALLPDPDALLRLRTDLATAIENLGP